MRAFFNRLYYGWVMVAVLTVANFTQVGEFNPVLAVFMKPFGEDFGWNRAEVSLGITLGSIGGGLIGPFMGPLVDRQGARVVLVVCQVIYGSCLLSLTFLGNSLLHFLLAYSLGRLVIQGGAQLGTQVAISNWFVRRRGLAMGVVSIGTRVGQAILPAVVAFITNGFNWRYAWLFLGLIVWIMAIVPSVLFLRRRPEDLGLLPDGDPVPKSAPSGQDAPSQGSSTTRPSPGTLAALSEPRWTLRQALRSKSLWFLTLASALSFFIGAGINLHLYPYLTDVGLSLPEAVAAASAFFAVSGAGAIFWGALLDRFPLRFCMASAFFISTVGIILLLNTSSLPMAFVFALIYGFSFGGLNTMTAVMWAVYFGRASVGKISGATLPVQLTTNAMGPFFGGWMYDHNGNYTAAFAVYAVAAFSAALFALAAGAPRLSSPEKSPVSLP